MGNSIKSICWKITQNLKQNNSQVSNVIKSPFAFSLQNILKPKIISNEIQTMLKTLKSFHITFLGAKAPMKNDCCIFHSRIHSEKAMFVIMQFAIIHVSIAKSELHFLVEMIYKNKGFIFHLIYSSFVLFFLLVFLFVKYFYSNIHKHSWMKFIRKGEENWSIFLWFFHVNNVTSGGSKNIILLSTINIDIQRKFSFLTIIINPKWVCGFLGTRGDGLAVDVNGKRKKKL